MMAKNEKKLHAGKWTPEEEAYVEGLMEEFRAGTLDIQEGTTLRSFLATKLNCKPKRISKKYEGKNYDGKQLYWNTEDDMSPEERRARRAKLQRLEHKFKECLKAIEMVKASRENPSATKDTGDASTHSFPKQVAFTAQQQQQPQSPLTMGLNADAFLAAQGAASSSPSLSAIAAPPLPSAAALYQRAAPAPAEAALALARRHRQQALELELAASASASNQAPSLMGAMTGLAGSAAHRGSMGGGHLGSLLSAPSSLQHSAARQEALLGLSSLNRPTSPSALGIHFPRPPSPRSAAATSQSSFLAEAAALEQARMAMVARPLSAATASGLSSFRPSLNTMLGASQPPSMTAVRRTSGNQLAPGGGFDESLMRLQQPMVRDLGATSDLLRQQFAQQQQQAAADQEERKRQAIEDELSQRKRQRFM